MQEIKKVLEKLSANDMHVKELLREDASAIQKAANMPMMPTDTHCIMQGDTVVHIGNLTTVTRFSLRL